MSATETIRSGIERMPAREELIRRKIRELEQLTGTKLPQLERELIPHPGEEIRPLTVRRKRPGRTEPERPEL